MKEGCTSEFDESNLNCSEFEKNVMECFPDEEKICQYENNATTCYVEVILSYPIVFHTLLLSWKTCLLQWCLYLV